MSSAHYLQPDGLTGEIQGLYSRVERTQLIRLLRPPSANHAPEGKTMVRICTLVLLGAALLAMPAQAGETPYGSKAPDVMYWWCKASTTSYDVSPARVTFYTSAIFQSSTSKSGGQRALQDAFWKYLVQEYGIPSTNPSASCLPSPTASGAEATRQNQSRGIKPVETNWKAPD